jgi:transcriptional regulator
MYIPNAFRIADRNMLLDFMARYGFATLVSDTPQGLFATHLPFLVERDGDRDVLCAHMARANPHWGFFDGTREAIVVFQGPHGYVSPSWYATSPAVPTWNYAVVHVYGRPRVVEAPDRVRSILNRLVDQHESSRPAPWKASRLPEDFADQMVKAIVGFEIEIDRLEGKFKLSQNRSDDDRAGVLAGLTDEGGFEGRALADFTRDAVARDGTR